MPIVKCLQEIQLTAARARVTNVIQILTISLYLHTTFDAWMDDKSNVLPEIGTPEIGTFAGKSCSQNMFG